MPNKKTKKQLIKEGKTEQEINQYFGINKSGRPVEWTEERAIELGNGLIAWMNEKDTNIFYKDYIRLNYNYSPQLISELSNKYKSFSELIKNAKSIQETKLCKQALFSTEIVKSQYTVSTETKSRILEKKTNTKTNPIGAIFLLKTKHGYTEDKAYKDKKLLLQEESLKLDQPRFNHTIVDHDPPNEIDI